MSLVQLLIYLASVGCYPGIYRRGNVWRAHVNVGGNFWSENASPQRALQTAVNAWQKAGRPMDGEAAEFQGAKSEKPR